VSHSGTPASRTTIQRPGADCVTPMVAGSIRARQPAPLLAGVPPAPLSPSGRGGSTFARQVVALAICCDMRRPSC
jgi:hypothetical protein